MVAFLCQPIHQDVQITRFSHLSDELAHVGVVVGADLGHGQLVGFGLDLPGLLKNGFVGNGHGLCNTIAQGDGADAGGDVLQAFGEDCGSQHRGGGGAVAGHVVGLVGHFEHELGAHVLEGIIEFDLFGDRDTVLGDVRSTEGLLKDDVASGGAEGDANGLGELLDAGAHFKAGRIVKHYLLSHGDCSWCCSV